MDKKVLFFTCYITTFLSVPLNGQVIWQESFNTPGLGIWGTPDGEPYSFTEGACWSLSCNGCIFTDETDYAKTVSTSGGRFEVLDSDGEATWSSPLIDVSSFRSFQISLVTGETGSGSNTEKKYIKASYLLDGLIHPVSSDSILAGNWGNATLISDSLKGSSLMIMVTLNSSYSNDKVFFDEVKVEAIIPGATTTAEPFDVVISEIMVDPTPPKALPEAEYIELYNRSPKTLLLDGWKMVLRSTIRPLPNVMMEPGKFALLCHPGDTSLLSPFSVLIPVQSFPSLINGGASLLITDKNGLVIDSISYSENWYGNTDKAKGGYSLERIDPDRFCGQRGNWKASDDPTGGTPGRSNSVAAMNFDSIPPGIKAVKIISDRQIDVEFSEPIMAGHLSDTKNWNISGGLYADSIRFTSETSTMTIWLSGPVRTNTPYSIRTEHVSDECGNASPWLEAGFSIPVIGPGNLLLSEILFNPKPGGSDFVEIYNPSEIPLDLSTLFLATRDNLSGFKSLCRLPNRQSEIAGISYLAFSTDIDYIIDQYKIPYPENLIEIEQLPPLSDTEGIVVLLNDSMQVIDEMDYNESMHTPYLNDVEGVSLERTSFAIPASDAGNWHSASSLSGFATPGYQNSAAGKNNETGNRVELDSEVVSPNGDGYNDELVICFCTDQPGYLAQIFVFDLEGRCVKKLKNNMLVNQGDRLAFSIFNGNEWMQNSGPFLLLIEIIHPSGKKSAFKKAFHISN